MQTLNFPFCCTGKILADFGDTVLSSGNKEPQTVEAVVEYIEKQMAIQSYMAFMTAVTNSDQTAANIALRRLGFNCSNWMTKKQHPNTKVRLWWKAIQSDETKKQPPLKSLKVG
jgi:hypothetical protein